MQFARETSRFLSVPKPRTYGRVGCIQVRRETTVCGHGEVPIIVIPKIERG